MLFPPILSLRNVNILVINFSNINPLIMYFTVVGYFPDEGTGVQKRRKVQSVCAENVPRVELNKC